jgi:hypothetical protein
LEKLLGLVGLVGDGWRICCGRGRFEKPLGLVGDGWRICCGKDRLEKLLGLVGLQREWEDWSVCCFGGEIMRGALALGDIMMGILIGFVVAVRREEGDEMCEDEAAPGDTCGAGVVRLEGEVLGFRVIVIVLLRP